jgi:DNA-binding NtrC family response regulator
MAAAYLAVGQPARAKACLSSALRQANNEEQIYGLLVETLAESQLVSGDLAGCADSLRIARENRSRLSQSRSAWHRAWNLRTEVRLLQRGGKWQESLSLIRSAGPREYSDSRPFTKVQVEALEALALIRTNNASEARKVIQRVVQDGLTSSESLQTPILAATAALTFAAGGDKNSLASCAQALRVVGATGETSSVVEIVDRIVELAGKDTSYSDDFSDLEPPDPLWRPTSIVCHLDACTPVFLLPKEDFGDVVSLMNSLADLASDPPALGEEALRCIVSMGWIKCGSVSQIADGNRRVVASFDSVAPGATRGADGDEGSLLGSVQVPLGSKQSRMYELSLSPQDSSFAAVNCYGIARLLATCCESFERNVPMSSLIQKSDVQQRTNDEEGLFRSPAMLALLSSAKRVAPLGISVLLTGESGTGKEVVARIIHRASGLPSEAFIAFNCATVPGEMVDGQLFGYRRGAFTGAVQGFKGVISAADGGTLLLDEVGELPLETQPKLLRFLDSGEIQPLGEAAPRNVRVRVIAATNADLEGLVQRGLFREDLYYRLNVVRFRLPPLRERREEIGPLVSMFLSKYAREFGKHHIHLSDAAKEHLLLFPWPGNVRQLSHELRRLVALSESDSVIDVDALEGGPLGRLGSEPQTPIVDSHRISIRIDGRLDEMVEEIERAALSHAIEATNGRLDLAAKRLGLSRKGLYLKRQRLGIA